MYAFFPRPPGSATRIITHVHVGEDAAAVVLVVVVVVVVAVVVVVVPTAVAVLSKNYLTTS
jgi:hypothetical protein